MSSWKEGRILKCQLERLKNIQLHLSWKHVISTQTRRDILIERATYLLTETILRVLHKELKYYNFIIVSLHIIVS